MTKFKRNQRFKENIRFRDWFNDSKIHKNKLPFEWNQTFKDSKDLNNFRNPRAVAKSVTYCNVGTAGSIAPAI